jgi:hypothetical protein
MALRTTVPQVMGPQTVLAVNFVAQPTESNGAAAWALADQVRRAAMTAAAKRWPSARPATLAFAAFITNPN